MSHRRDESREYGKVYVGGPTPPTPATPSTLKVVIGKASYESEGPFNLETFKLWLNAVAPPLVDTDTTALVATLKAKSVDITKYAQELVAAAATMDATAPSVTPSQET